MKFAGKSLWMLEIKEIEHKHMNYDSIYTYTSMKYKKMNKITRNTFTMRKQNTDSKKNNTGISNKTYLDMQFY